MNLADRVKGILLTPRSEWSTIDAESATVGSLYTTYIIPLAAIQPVAMFIGFSLIGTSFLGSAFRLPISNGIEWAIAQYVGSLISVFIFALIIDALAPTFGGEKNRIQALKVATYSMTAAWICGIFAIVPSLAVLGILGLYSLYLLYLGLPVLMKAPQDKAIGYTVVSIVAGIVLFVVIRAITARFGFDMTTMTP
ncbi:MAG TPA: Yip1 family protein [Gemmatimonadales bacterium]